MLCRTCIELYLHVGRHSAWVSRNYILKALKPSSVLPHNLSYDSLMCVYSYMLLRICMFTGRFPSWKMHLHWKLSIFEPYICTSNMRLFKTCGLIKNIVIHFIFSDDYIFNEYIYIMVSSILFQCVQSITI